MSGLVYKNVFSLSCVLLLTACSSTAVVRPPEYKTPLIQADEQYKYAALNWTETAGLKGATVAWWDIYQDPVLSQLLQQLNAENLNLKQAEARYRQANALLEQQKASRSVSLSLEGTAKRNGAKHKQAVLTGWKEVDDALMQTSSLKQQQLEQAQLLQLTKENEQVVLRRYNAGLVSYLELVTAQNLRLQAEQSTLELQQIQLKNTAQLITALGGSIS